MEISKLVESSGRFLFRWRSYLPLILIAGIVIEILYIEDRGEEETISLIWKLSCVGIALFGEIIRLYVSGTVPAGTSGRATHELKTSELNIDGLYSLVRHPLYLGNFIIWIGASMFFQKWYIVVGVAIIFLIYYRAIIAYEEKYLQLRFGKAFAEWSQKVPAMFPLFRNYTPAKLSFNIKAAIKKEHDSIFALIAIFYFFELVYEYKHGVHLSIHSGWFMVFIISVPSWILIKVMKKARCLDVTGR